jgi:hypothetical protein
MELHPIHTLFGRVLAAWVAVSGLMAAEHHGFVKFGGLPIPGASVTATMGDKKVATTTDDNGRYAFADLADGTWTLEIEMLGFARLTKEVGIALDAPSPEWNLTFLTMNAITSPPGAPTAEATPAPVAPTTAAQATSAKPPAAPAAPSPATATQRSAAVGGPGRAGRGQQAANGGRPSLAQANNFQRLDVNASADATAINPAEGAISEASAADMSQSADAAFVVNGSVSRGLDMPQQNDWFGGPGGRMGMDGMGGPGGPGGPGGLMGMDGMGGGQGGDAMGGGRGGPGGGPGGRGGGPGGGGPGAFGGGPGGFGGRGGGGFGGGGPGGRGGGPGGRGGDRAQGRGPGGRAGVASFGNARRNPRAQYNGNAAFTLDNSVWDARSYSINGQDTAKPAYAKARATIMFSGPLKIPKLFDNSKGTFTFNYQLGRTRNGTTSTQTMPTLLERTGDFSQSIGAQGPVTIYDPLTGSPFPGNVIPVNRINPASLGLLKYFPAPNGPGYKYNFQTPITLVQNSDNVNTRLSQTLTKKDRINGGLGYQGSNNTTPNIFNFIDTGNGHSWNANISWSHNFTTRVISNLRYTYSRATSLTSPFFANRDNVAADLGITGTSQAPLNWGPPTLSFTNYAALSDGNSALTRNQTSAVGESIIWVHGLHNMTFGGDFSRRQNNRFADPNPRGTFAFTGLTTSDIVNGVAANGTGFDFADFLLGNPDTSAARYGNGNLYYRTTAYDVYATDDWRMSQVLTINFGVRYDYSSPISELFNRMVNLNVAPGFASIVPVLAGQSGAYPGSLVRPDRNNFSPRIGFSWRPIPKKSMVVRGGYGIYYNTQVYNTIANNMAQQPPYSTTLSIATNLANPLTLQNGFIVPPGTTYTNTYAVDPNYRIGYAQIWQLSVQQDLGHSLVGTITYNGTKGTRLDQSVLPNSAPPGARPLPFPSGYIYESANGNSIYHGASFQLNRRFRNGISFSSNYVYSKAIDNAVQAQDFLDTSAERARSAGSRTHTANFMWQYSTGVGRGGGTLVNGWKGALLKDWTVQNMITVASGAWLTPIIGGNRSTTTGTGITGSVRANATGLSVTDAPAGEPFNFAAFAAPAAGQWGNAGRDTIPGPMQFNLRGSISRVFRIGERRSADLQFAATNALNHVTFSGFNTTIGSNSLGLLTGPSAMRSITATLRFRF